MRKFWDEFKEFALGGNLVETAVALVMALATAELVGALVESVVMPLIGGLLGAPDISSLWVIAVNESAIRFGSFVTALVNFLAIALGVYVFVVKPWNTYKRLVVRGEEPAPEAPSEDIVLLREIRDALRGGA